MMSCIGRVQRTPGSCRTSEHSLIRIAAWHTWSATASMLDEVNEDQKRRIVSVPNQQLTIYEINIWVWLSGLIEKSGGPVNLGSVPPPEWDAIAQYGFDAVWLMGVWERSPAGIAIANRNATLMADFQRALPDFRPEDNVGSAYCVRRYVVDQHLGGPEGLAIARRELASRGMKLLLDFVPNHVAPDNPWIEEHPEHFIETTAD